MTTLFLKLLNMSIVASWVILAVLVLRLLLKKAPKWINCVLWAVVGIRLIVPVSIESMFSLLPTAEPIPDDLFEQTEFSETVSKEQGELSFVGKDDHLSYDVSEDETIEQSNTVPETSAEISEPPSVIVGTESNHNTENTSNGKKERMLMLISAVWLAGIICMSAYAVYSYLRIYVKVRFSVLVDKKAYINDEIDTPFILGLLRPRIYMPSALSDDEQKHVMLHERAHLTRLDHIWKPLGYAVLTVYWFNPLIWLAYYLLCKDIEFACDERVIKKLNASEKVAYTTTLLQCSVPRKLITACPLAFGEVRTKERIKTVLHYKKPTFWIIIIAVVICIIFAVAFLTDPIKDKNSHEGDMSQEIENDDSFSDESQLTESEMPSDETEYIPVTRYSTYVQLGGEFGEHTQEAAITANCMYRFYHSESTPDFIDRLGMKASLIRIETFEQLEKFTESLKQSAEHAEYTFFYDGNLLKKYDRNFFTDKTLVIVQTEDTDQPDGVRATAYVAGTTLNISLERTFEEPNGYQTFFHCLELDTKTIENCASIDLHTSFRLEKSIDVFSYDIKERQLSKNELQELQSYFEIASDSNTFFQRVENRAELEAFLDTVDSSSAFHEMLSGYHQSFFEENVLFFCGVETQNRKNKIIIDRGAKIDLYYNAEYAPIEQVLRFHYTLHELSAETGDPCFWLHAIPIKRDGLQQFEPDRYDCHLFVNSYYPVAFSKQFVSLRRDQESLHDEVEAIAQKHQIHYVRDGYTTLKIENAEQMQNFLNEAELLTNTTFELWNPYTTYSYLDSELYDSSDVYVIYGSNEDGSYIPDLYEIVAEHGTAVFRIGYSKDTRSPEDTTSRDWMLFVTTDEFEYFDSFKVEELS